MEGRSKTDSTPARQFEAATVQETHSHSALRVSMCSQGARRLCLKPSHDWGSSSQSDSQLDGNEGHGTQGQYARSFSRLVPHVSRVQDSGFSDEAVDSEATSIWTQHFESKAASPWGSLRQHQLIELKMVTTKMDLTTSHNSCRIISSFQLLSFTRA